MSEVKIYAPETKATKISTPRGVAVWPRLDKPDTKFNADGYYSVKLRLSAEESANLIEKLEPMAEQAFEEAKVEYAEKYAAANKAKQKKMEENPPKLGTFPWAESYDDNDEETGEYEFNFKMKASGISKKNNKPWKRSPKLFDAKGKPVKAGLQVWGGSILKVNGGAKAYYMPATGMAGVSIQLEAVQVIELRQGGGDASDYGFTDEEGGFNADEVGDDGFTDETATSGSSDSDNDEADGDEADF